MAQKKAGSAGNYDVPPPDPLDMRNEPFETERQEPMFPPGAMKQQHAQKPGNKPAQYGNDSNFLQVLLPSQFTIKGTGEVVTEWTVVGRAFPTERGWKIVLKQNLIVTGELILMPPRE